MSKYFVILILAAFGTSMVGLNQNSNVISDVSNIEVSDSYMVTDSTKKKKKSVIFLPDVRTGDVIVADNFMVTDSTKKKKSVIFLPDVRTGDVLVTDNYMATDSTKKKKSVIFLPDVRTAKPEFIAFVGEISKKTLV